MRRRTILPAMLLALAPLAPSGARAQTETLPEPGARVRVAAQTPAGRWETVVGTLVAAGGDSLVLRPEGRGEAAVVVLPASRVRGLEVSQGRSSRGASAARKGVVAGILGAMAGAALGIVAHDTGRDEGLNILTRQDMAIMGAAWVGGLSGIGGALYGRAYPAERWSPAALPRTSASVGPGTDGGVAVSMSVKL